MKGNIQNLLISGHECLLYIPDSYCHSGKSYPVVYMNGESNIQEIMEDVESHFNIDCGEFMLLSIQSENWNEEFTPWSAPALIKNGEPFGGGAPKYLSFLEDTVKPFIDKNYRTKPEPSDTAMIGYSLGGLTSLYALYIMKTFGKIGSLSGSLWYDGWMEFMDSHIPANTFASVYMSLGRSEEFSRNPRMAKVGYCTRKAALLLEEQLEYKVNLKLQWNNGGHFTEIPERFKKALLWLMHCKV